MTDEIYGIIIDEYCIRHFIKDFEKKYHPKKWRLTLLGIKDTLASPIVAINQTNYLETISQRDNILICKGSFKIFASNKSPKSSGYRYIVKIDKESKTSRILLIYAKKHIVGNNETVWWQGIIKEQFGL